MAVIIVWAVLPVILAALIFYTAHPQTPRARVGIAVAWLTSIGLASPYTLGQFREGWPQTVIFWGVVAVGALSLLWAIVLIKPPAARPPVAPGKPSNYVASSQTRTYRSQRRWL